MLQQYFIISALTAAVLCAPLPAESPAIGVPITDIPNTLIVGEIAVSKLSATSSTQNDLASGKCADMTVIFARGTTETGNVGTVTGPPFFAAIQKAVGSSSVAVQGVDYPADIPGFLAGGDAKGSATMAGLITSAMTKCPNTKVVMSGYSQGGQLVHKAAAALPASTMAKVSSVVIFGDPNNGDAVAGASKDKTLVVCHAGDNICDHGNLILAPHLTYGIQDADSSAKFVAAQAGL